MGFSQHESQLELFDVKGEATPRPRAEYPGRVFLQLRHDQLVLSAVAVVISLTVIFAFGVERGKQLVRSERMLLARDLPDEAPAPVSEISSRTTETRAPVAAPAAPAVTTTKPAAPKPAATPAAAPKPKIKAAQATTTTAPAAKTASAKTTGKGGRYTVQVATFGKATAARRELDRLQAKGKRAFIVIRDGRTIVHVGPFPSKTNASEELSELKTQYRDCFVKAL